MTVPRWIIVAALGTWAPWSMAIGLGPIQVQSGLGQPLRASVPLLSAGAPETGGYCIKAQVSAADGTLIAAPQASVRGGDRPSDLVLNSRQPINEPAVTVSIDFGCTNRVHRDFTVLLDFPTAATIPFPAEPRALPETGERAPGKASPAKPPAPVAAAKTIVERSAAQTPAPARKKPAAKPATTAMEAGKPVLRLTADDAPSAGMRMSDSLAPDTGASALPPLAANDGTRAERERFAAMMRGEDVSLKQAEDLQAMQEKLRLLSIEIAQLRQQTLAAQPARPENDALFSPLVASLGAALLLALGAAGWLALRLRDAGRRAQDAWWDDMEHDPMADREIHRERAAPQIHVDEHTDHRTNAEPMAADNVSLFPRLADKEPARRQDMPGGLRTATGKSGTGTATAGIADDTGIAFPHSVSLNMLSGLHGYQSRMPKAEVISDVVQEAEFWMLLNNPQRALQILEPYGVDQRPESPVAWLYLLDLYRSLDRREDYDSLAARFKRIFNARIPAWDEQENPDAPASLENFPRLVENICNLWPDDGAVPYLESLLVDDRDGERVGFDLPVYREIIMLIGLATEAARGRRQAVG